MRSLLVLIVAIGSAGCFRERFAGFADPAEKFVASASRGDSAAMMLLATDASPVRRMLEISRVDSGLVAAAATGLDATYGSVQAGTAAVAFKPRMDRESPELGFVFIRRNRRWLITSVQVTYASDITVPPAESQAVPE